MKTKTETKLTKEMFKKLYDRNITKGEYDEIEGLIEERFGDVWPQIAKAIGAKVSWFDFNTEHGEDSPGYFDIMEFEQYIGVTGDWSGDEFDLLSEIPTRWLWEDVNDAIKEIQKEKAELIKKKNETKEQAKAKREALKIKKAEMKKIISDKLTKEELKFVKFK